MDTVTMQTRIPAALAALAVAAGLGLAAPTGAAAQEQSLRTTVGWGLSLFHFSPFVERTAEETAGASLENSLGGVLFLHHWLNPWVGIHADGTYTRPRLMVPDQRATVDTWSVAVGGTLRPLGAPAPVGPFAMASAGLIRYGLGGPPLRLTDTDLILDTDRTEQFMFQLGAGLDVALLTLPGHEVLGLRAEAARLIVTGRPFRLEEQDDPGGHSHWRFSLGLHTSLPRH